MPVRVIGRIAPFTDDAFKVVNAGDLGGLFVKSVSPDGLITYQDASGHETNRSTCYRIWRYGHSQHSRSFRGS